MVQKVAVIVPVKGIPYYFVKCVASLLSLDYPDYEVIVVDDGLDPGIYAALCNFKGKVRILKSDSRGPSFARNLAAGNTDAGLVAFTDSDCIVERSWLKELVKGLAIFPAAVSCGGVQKSPEDASRFQKDAFAAFEKSGLVSEYMREGKNKGVIEVDHNASCNAIYRRDVFLKEGGFFENLWPGEDVELDHRLKRRGYKIVFNPEAVVYHYRPEALRKLSRMMLRYGVVQAFLVRRYGIFRKVQFIPFVLLSALTVVLLTGAKGLMVGFIFLIWGLLILAAYFLSLRVMSIFLIMAISWNAGFFTGLFKKNPLAKK